MFKRFSVFFHDNNAQKNIIFFVFSFFKFSCYLCFEKTQTLKNLNKCAIGLSHVTIQILDNLLQYSDAIQLTSKNEQRGLGRKITFVGSC